MINATQEEIQKRFENIKKNKTFTRIINKYNLNKKKVLDIGCSYGEFLVLMGSESVGLNSTQEEKDYADKIGLKMIKGNAELVDEVVQEKFEVLWANNLFEHILSPHAFLIRLKKISHSDTKLILGVPVVPRIHSLLKLNLFRGSLASLHINFFTKKSLELTAEFAGWKKIESRPFKFENKFLDNLFSFIAPHIYLILENDSSWKYAEKKVHEWESEEMYQKYLKMLGNI